MSFNEKKENIEWRKRVFESKLSNKYEIEIQNGMNVIHRNKVNKITECNLLHDIINYPKHTKHLNIYYYSDIHGWMNTQKGRAKFKNFRILLNNGYSYTIVMGRIIEKLNPKGDAVM